MSFFSDFKKKLNLKKDTQKKGERVSPRSDIAKENEKMEKPKKISLKKITIEKEIPQKKERGDVSPLNPSVFFKPEGELIVDVFQTDSEFIVKSPIAGIDVEDLDVAVENNMLIIRGERKETSKEEKKNYFYQECYWGAFSKKVMLPEDVDIERIKASLNKGVLIVRIPRIKKITKQKIEVKEEE